MGGTVYILGAGSSRAETLEETLPTPLVTDFFKKQYLKEYWSDIEFDSPFKTSALNFVLSRYFASTTNKGRPATIDNINVEEVYSFLHSFDRVFSGVSYRRDYFELARRQLHEYIISVIRYSSWQKRPSKFLAHVLSTLGPNDSIITFNWDTLIDQAIAASTNPVCLELKTNFVEIATMLHKAQISDWDSRVKKFHSGRLLKIHGAINMTQCKNQSCYRHENPYVWEASEENPEHWSCEHCGSPTQVMILPPHGAKTYTAGRFFRLQANLAAEKLSLAEKIVVVGYSCPVFDIEARSMLRCSRIDDEYGSQASLVEVAIIDPKVVDPSHSQAIANLIGIDNYAAHGHQVTLSLYKNISDYMINKKFDNEPT